MLQANRYLMKETVKGQGKCSGLYFFLPKNTCLYIRDNI